MSETAATTTASSEISLVEIAQRFGKEHRQMVLEGQKRRAVNHNQASSLGHDCLAYLYYMRTAWDQFALPSYELEQRFRVGRQREKYIRAEVEAIAERLGAEVIENKISFVDEEHQISGELDSLIRFNQGNKLGLPAKTKAVLEMKTLSQNVDVDTFEDLMRTQLGRKWVIQCYSYMYLRGIELAIIAVELLTGILKFIVFKFDYSAFDAILKKSAYINAAVALKDPPEKLADPAVCRTCPALGVCRPPLKWGVGAEFKDEPALINALESRDKAAGFITQMRRRVRQFDELDDMLKTTIKEIARQAGGTDRVIIGNWQAMIGTTTRKGYAIGETVVTTVQIEKLARREEKK